MSYRGSLESSGGAEVLGGIVELEDGGEGGRRGCPPDEASQ